MKNKKPFFYIKQPKFNNGRELCRILKKNNIIISPWIEDIIKKKKFNFSAINFPYNFYIINLKKDLGIKKQVKLKNVYSILLKKKYKLVGPALAIYSRIFIPENHLRV